MSRKTNITLLVADLILIAGYTTQFYFSKWIGLDIIINVFFWLLVFAEILFFIFGGKSRSKHAKGTDFEYVEDSGDISAEDNLSPEQIEMIKQAHEKNRNIC